MMSLRAAFLIIVGSVFLHLPYWETVVLFLGYAAFEKLDQMLATRVKEKWIEGELFDWKPDPDDPESEVKGGLIRKKLTGENQTLFARVAQLLRGAR